MKIGIVHFGSFSNGATQIVTSLMEGIQKYSYRLYALEWNQNDTEIEARELHIDSIQETERSGNALIRSFPKEKWNNISDHPTLSLLDSIIVLGEREQQEVTESQSVRTLHIPVSIFNDIDGTHYTLGYDTALNSIITDIERIRDTASSMLYHKVRVFNVQIPGENNTPLLEDAALAVGATLISDTSEQEIETMKSIISEKEKNGETYVFFMMNQSIDIDFFKEPITTEFTVDWKEAVIDQSQCVGPYPTALDIILTKKIIAEIFTWIENGATTGRFVIQNNKVLFQ